MTFYKNMADVYHFIFPSQGKIDFLSKQFQENSHLLDVGCSDGRVSEGLAKRGHSVIGIDYSEDMIAVARRISDKLSNMTVAQMDMRDVFEAYGSRKFNGIFCIGNTLVHLTNLEEIKSLLFDFNTMLDENGKLVLQIIHYDAVIANKIRTLPLIDNEHVRFERNYAFDTPLIRFSTKLLIKSNGNVYEADTALLGLKMKELDLILNEVGFKDVQWYGDFTGKPLDESSLQLILVANK